jgi:hypothetical protein
MARKKPGMLISAEDVKVVEQLLAAQECLDTDPIKAFRFLADYYGVELGEIRLKPKVTVTDNVIDITKLLPCQDDPSTPEPPQAA